jgi:hypothetical protein
MPGKGLWQQASLALPRLKTGSAKTGKSTPMPITIEENENKLMTTEEVKEEEAEDLLEDELFGEDSK